jgi:hypothetical protein
MVRTLLVGIAALLSACAATSTTASCDGAQPCRAELLDVAILDRTTGERLTVYNHDGQRWISGTPGHRYAVSVRSRSPGRILGVVSVDGVNVVTGATAAWGQSGYVLSPWESFDILGWRKSQERVADFVFTDLENSYAARTGRPDDVGVIGVAVFREAVQAPPPPPSSGRDEAPSERATEAAPLAPPAAGAIAPLDRRLSEQRLGTGHGQSEVSRVQTVDFERAQDHPDQLVVIRYERRERLIAMGVIPIGTAPRPFPHSASAGFVPDPPSR